MTDGGRRGDPKYRSAAGHRAAPVNRRVTLGRLFTSITPDNHHEVHNRASIDTNGTGNTVVQSSMFEIDHLRDQRHLSTEVQPAQELLAAENVSLKLLLAQAEIDARGLLAQAGIDARVREAADKLQKLILEELHHRIKNTLATVAAIASQSLRNVPGAGHAQQAIEGRLLALGRAHDLLLQAQWSSAYLGKIVRGATEAFDNPDMPKFTIAGPDVRMTSGAVIAIAMTLNELCTNATKFGALSVPAGRIDIAWTLDSETHRLNLTWTEKNGPAVQAPDRRSFGTRLVETLGRQLKGDVRLTYEPSGFVYTLDVPLESLMSTASG
jgi:two-component sensor histidine kinase